MKMFDRDHLIELAGERAFQRGEEYFRWRRIRDLSKEGGRVNAIVEGAQSYFAWLQENGSQLGYGCDCPEGKEGRCCKHCVAIGLSWLEAEKDGGFPANADSTELRKSLSELTTENLVELVLQQASRDAHFRQDLRLKAARLQGAEPNLDEQRRLLELASEAAVTAEDVDGFATILKDVKAALTLLLEEGFAVQAALLIEDAPASHYSGWTETAERLFALLLTYHRKSCQQMCITPDALAARLLEWQLRCPTVARAEVTDSYIELLGNAGWELYRQLAQAEWEQMHADGNPHLPAQRERCDRLTLLMAHAANKSRDIAALIAIKRQHTENACSYLELAQLCMQMGDEAQAIAWGQRGILLFPIYEVGGLYEFLAETYEVREDWTEALAVWFAQFQAQPSLLGYQRIAACAQKAAEWGLWRARALNTLQNDSAADSSTLVSALLWEMEDDAAWQAAKNGGCRDGLWQEIAKRRERKHPEDALFIYKRLVAQYASCKNSYSYELAVQTLRRMARLLRKQKRQEEFLPFVESLCRQHRYQHALIKMLRQLVQRHSRKGNTRNNSFGIGSGGKKDSKLSGRVKSTHKDIG